MRAPALVGSGPGGRGGTRRYSPSPEKAPGGVLGPKSDPKWLGKPEAAEFGPDAFCLGRTDWILRYACGQGGPREALHFLA